MPEKKHKDKNSKNRNALYYDWDGPTMKDWQNLNETMMRQENETNENIQCIVNNPEKINKMMSETSHGTDGPEPAQVLIDRAFIYTRNHSNEQEFFKKLTEEYSNAFTIIKGVLIPSVIYAIFYGSGFAIGLNFMVTSLGIAFLIFVGCVLHKAYKDDFNEETPTPQPQI